jgi:hypothetical protein
MISLAYFPVNAAFAFILGPDLKVATMFRLDGEDLFFRTRAEAVAALKRHNLGLDGNKVVVAL